MNPEESEHLVAELQLRKPQFQCGLCLQSFTRMDHLRRHVSSHTQGKPFRCSVCHKGFKSRDLLKRHMVGHEPQGERHRKQQRYPTYQTRTQEACRACARAKIKCNDEKPCQRCRDREIECQYTTKDWMAESEHQASIGQKDGTSSLYSNNMTRDQPASEQSAPQFNLHDSPPSAQASPIKEGTTSTPLAESQFYSNNPENGATALGSEQTVDGEDSSLIWQHDVFNFTDTTSIDLDDQDPVFPGQLGGRRAADDATDSSVGMEILQTCQSTGDKESAALGRPVALEAEAFRQPFLRRWLPVAGKDELTEELCLSATLDPNAPGRSWSTVHPQCPSKAVDRHTRDRMLASILNTCELETARQIISCFPSCQLLGELAQQFFSWSYHEKHSYMHVGTFNPNEQHPILLSAVIACGATLTGKRNLQKLALMIHDALQSTLTKVCNGSNQVTRELWLLQCFMCELDIGLWSGNQRKMEITEGLRQVFYTMLRQGGNFHMHRNAASLIPTADDTGEVLTAKWHQWVNQESYRRLAYRAFIHDALASMSLFVSPLVSYTELTVALPSAQELWLAQDADSWKSLCLKTNNESCSTRETHLSLLSCLQDPMQMANFGLYHYDMDFSMLIILQGIWGSIWEILKLLASTKTRPGYYNTSLMVRHHDLSEYLNQTRKAILYSNHDHCPEILLLVDLLTMHLHISIEEARLFAGGEGQDEACRVLPLFKCWIGDQTSRKCIWHAGQVIRTAKKFRPGALRGFYALAIYHASLSLWTYGVLVRSGMACETRVSPPEKKTPDRPNRAVAVLNGLDSIEVQQFLATDWGEAYISLGQSGVGDDDGSSSLIPITDTVGVVNMVLGILRDNLTSQAVFERPPPLLENLMQLIGSLGKASGAIAHDEGQ